MIDTSLSLRELCMAYDELHINQRVCQGNIVVSLGHLENLAETRHGQSETQVPHGIGSICTGFGKRRWRYAWVWMANAMVYFG